MAKQIKSALGRGIDALIKMDDLNTGGSSSIDEVELSKIEPNPDQPRSVFDQEALEDLAASINSLGIIQPITLREIQPDRYQIISGERRYKASLMAGLTSIPAYIRKADDENMMKMALIENIQREDLDIIEIALAFKALMEKHDLTQEELSEQIGKKRGTIANYLRILKLPAEIQIGLKNKKIDMGHAKLLVSLEDPSTQLMVYEQIIEYGYTVRKTDEIVKELNSTESNELPEDIPAKPKLKASHEYDDWNNHLSSSYGVKVSIIRNEKGSGKISFSFKDDEELQSLLQVFDSVKNIL